MEIRTLLISLTLLLTINGNALTYYVSANTGNDSNSGTTSSSAWKTMNKINSFSFSAGDSILFKRNETWRGQLIPKSGVSGASTYYGAYSTGEKPTILGSLNFSNISDWTNLGANIWKCDTTFSTDIGNILFDDATSVGFKKWNLTDLQTQNDYWFDLSTNELLLYSTSNPGSIYTEIELALRKNIINQQNTRFITFENLSIKYGAAHGFGGGNTANISINSCNISYIGGGDLNMDGKIRYGNGIEFWGNASNNTVSKCKIWEIYDTGLTNQNHTTSATQQNIKYQNNIIWNCGLSSFEYWNRPSSSTTSNIYFENNTCLNAGYGWGNQRPDYHGIHILFDTNPAQTDTIYIRNNILYNAKRSIYAIEDNVNGSIELDYNVIYQPASSDTLFVLFPSFTVYSYSNFSAYKTATQKDLNSLTGNPDFVNLNGNNFSLLNSSIAIDAGVTLPISEDIEGNPRPYNGVFDIGAYELSKPLEVTDNARCGEGTVVLQATSSSGTINWYDVATGGSLLATGISFTTPSIDTSTIFYVSAGNTTSTRTAVVATVNPLPTAVIEGSDTLCDGDITTIIVGFTGIAPWDVIYKIDGVDQPTITGITTSPYTFTTSTTGAYTLSAVEDSLCSGTIDGTATISEHAGIQISDTLKTCNDANTKYVVEFNIQGGDTSAYAVTGGAGVLSGNHFTSDSIDAGTAFEFFINDGSTCGNDTLEGTNDCSTPTCNASYSMYSGETICPGGVATISMTLGGIAPWSFTYAVDYVDQETFTGIMTSPFTFTTTAEGNYTISMFADSTECTPVMTTLNMTDVIANTPITTAELAETCNVDNSKYVVEFDISGGDSTTYVITGGTGTLISSHFTSDSIASGTAYEFFVYDTYSCNTDTVSGTKDCSVPTPTCNATATISGSDSICSDTTATITIALVGTAPWDVVYKIDGAVQPTITGITASPYTFTTATTGAYTLLAVEDSTCNGTVDGEAIIAEATGCDPAPACDVTAVIDGTTSLCDDEVATITVVLTGTAPWGIMYQVDGANDMAITGITASPYTFTTSTTGVYTLSSVINNTCSGTVDGSATISEGTNCNPGTTCDVTATIVGTDSICDGEESSIYIVLAGTAPWYLIYAIDNVDQPTVTGISTSPYSFKVLSTGVYTISTVGDNTCTGTSDGSAIITEKVDCNTVGVDENTSTSNFSLYPNPNSGVYNISIANSNLGNVTIAVFNLFGEEVYTTVADNNTKEIDCSHLAAGVYYVQLASKSDSATVKLIIQ